MLFFLTMAAVIIAQFFMISQAALADREAFDQAISALGLSELGPDQRIHAIIAINSLAQAIIVGLMVTAGSFAAPRLGLRSLIAHKTPDTYQFIKAFPIYMLIGILIGALTLYLDQIFLNVFPELAALQADSAAIAAISNQNLIASFITRFLWGGIYEEVLMRWGIMALIAWIMFKFTKARLLSIGIGIFGAAILFGIGHLPALAAANIDATSAVIFRTILLNGLFGVAAGIAFTRNSLEAAMILHASGHIALLGWPLLQAN